MGRAWVLALLVVLAGCTDPEPAPGVAREPIASTRPLAASRPIVVLMTDFGLRDDAVALMRGVALSIARDGIVADLTHEVPRFDVAEGARILADAPGYYPPGTAFACVVDPGVGTSRKAIAMRLKNGRTLVGPDNGLLSLAAERWGVEACREIKDPRFRAADVSSTFHGRDVFAPAAAHLALGSPPFEEIGPVLATWLRLEEPPCTVEKDAVKGLVTSIDEPFGNLWTNVSQDALAKLGVKKGDKLVVDLSGTSVEAPWVETFGDVAEGKPLFYLSSRGRLALALNMGDAARTWKAKKGDPVRVARAR